jgi:4-diphosphocytidyl-2-C-methyl-D-erythritol kinase
MIETGHAYAKINISLDIISKMDNGFHNLKSIMQSVSLNDEITIECIPSANTPPGNGVRVVDPGRPFLPSDDRNIAAKAARAFLVHNDISDYKTDISIKKNIPVCAGLGGGSADGACVLRMMDKMFETNLSQDTLSKIGNEIGSDIPFCIFGGTKLAQGKGEILTDLAPIPQCYIVICKPSFNFSTPELFKGMDCKKINTRPDTEGIVASLDNYDLQGVARRMYNVFEDFLPRGSSDIDDIKYRLLDYGALGAVMTGSGPTVFGIFDNDSKASNAHCNLKQDFKDTYLTSTVGSV